METETPSSQPNGTKGNVIGLKVERKTGRMASSNPERAKNSPITRVTLVCELERCGVVQIDIMNIVSFNGAAASVGFSAEREVILRKWANTSPQIRVEQVGGGSRLRLSPEDGRVIRDVLGIGNARAKNDFCSAPPSGARPSFDQGRKYRVPC